MSTGPKDHASRIAAVITEPIQRLGFDVEAVEITPAGKRRVLTVAVDKDGGVTIDDTAEVSREVSQLLDDSDAMGQRPYTLQVTSRGVSRPLTLPRHWRRNRTRLVQLTTTTAETVTGRITDSDDSAVTLEVDGVTRTVDYADVDKALIQIEFNRPTAGEED